MKESKDIRILVAEDEYLIGREIVAVLTNLGYDPVAVAPDGEAAVEMTMKLEPDLVLMDIRMPKRNGLSAAREIQEKNPTPVIVLTAHETDSLVTEARDAGVSAFLTKPISSKATHRAIMIALARHHDLVEIKRINRELRDALEEIDALRGILPICAWCKKVRNDQGFWEQVEAYFHRRSELEFSHAICPDCLDNQCLAAKPPERE